MQILQQVERVQHRHLLPAHLPWAVRGTGGGPGAFLCQVGIFGDHLAIDILCQTKVYAPGGRAGFVQEKVHDSEHAVQVLVSCRGVHYLRQTPIFW